MGTSDPVSFECTCSAKDSGGGTILLFYRYFDAPPRLPIWHERHATGLEEIAAFHRTLCKEFHLTGKIRIATEGFNITVGGTQLETQSYTQACIRHWTFDGLDLGTQEKQDAYFKPSGGGCACAFESANVRIASEITPLGVSNYTPKDWDVVKSLSPAEFHEKCWNEGNKVLIDVRNHYESRIGYFIDPRTGEKALTPEVRRFSQFPLYVKTHTAELEGRFSNLCEKKSIMTYCTGGIRCEKGVRWMAEKLPLRDGDTICTLSGGIAAYLTWMDEEIKLGRKTANDSLFRGRNYVFDARGSTSLQDDRTVQPVSRCHICGTGSDRLSKCQSKRCHLVLVVCEACERERDPRCCQNCAILDSVSNPVATGELTSGKNICACELEREAKLWGNRETKKKRRTKKVAEMLKSVDI